MKLNQIRFSCSRQLFSLADKCVVSKNFNSRENGKYSIKLVRHQSFDRLCVLFCQHMLLNPVGEIASNRTNQLNPILCYSSFSTGTVCPVLSQEGPQAYITKGNSYSFVLEEMNVGFGARPVYRFHFIDTKYG